MIGRQLDVAANATLQASRERRVALPGVMGIEVPRREGRDEALHPGPVLEPPSRDPPLHGAGDGDVHGREVASPLTGIPRARDDVLQRADRRVQGAASHVASVTREATRRTNQTVRRPINRWCGS